MFETPLARLKNHKKNKKVGVGPCNFSLRMRGPPKSKSKPSSSPKAAVAVAAAPAPNKSSTEKSKKKVLGVCKFFLAGNCKRGSSCPFVHENTLVDVPSSSSDNSESSASSLFDDISAPAITYACPFCKVRKREKKRG